MSEKLSSQGDWYCRNCGYIDCSRVTFSETCDTCHQPVEWHTNEQQDKISTIRRETIEECAKIADNHKCTGLCDDDGFGQMCDDVIATEIRALAEEK